MRRLDKSALDLVQQRSTLQLFVIVDGDRPSAKKGDEAWQRFVANKALLRRHAITKGELKVLKQVTTIVNVAHPGHFIFILNAIRQAGAEL